MVTSSPSTASSIVTSVTTASHLVASSTSDVAASQPTRGLSKTTIALLAVIGSFVVSVFVGCFIYSQVKTYRARRRRDPSKPLASLSLNLSTGRGPQTNSGPSTREINTTSSEGSRRVRRTHDVSHEPEVQRMPPSRPQQQQQANQTSEMSVEDEVPQYRFASHPYQTITHDLTSSLPTDLAKQSQSDMRSLALALRVSSHAPGSQGSSASRVPFVGHVARESQSSSGHDHGRPDSAGRSDEAMIPPSRPPLKISTTPLVSSNPKLPRKVNPPERRYSKSFLVFEDGDSPTSSSQVVFKPPSTLPVTPEHVPEQKSDPGGGTAPSSIRMMTAIASYAARLQDELSLNVGDVVKLVCEYDDGWCVVERVGTKNDVRAGAVPRVCLDEQAST